MAGSSIAVLAEVHVEDDGRVAIDRLVAAVDCGRQINPDLVRQQIEGGLVFAAALATGCAQDWAEGRATVRRRPTFACRRWRVRPRSASS
ncbi:molybdopterin cofactor-binding domain-containing protein [Sphingomonas sp. MMS24-JH45]